MASSLILGFVAALIAGAPPAAPREDAITVTGVRLNPEAVRAVDFVHATGVAAGELPAARWIEPVCPHVVGLVDEAARVVEAKVRGIAAAANIAAARVPCTTNIAIVFATDGGAVVRDIAARAPRRMGGVRPAAVAALTGGPAPIRWWYASEVRDKDGIGASADGIPARVPSPGESRGSVLPANEDTTFMQH